MLTGITLRAELLRIIALCDAVVEMYSSGQIDEGTFWEWYTPLRQQRFLAFELWDDWADTAASGDIVECLAVMRGVINA